MSTSSHTATPETLRASLDGYTFCGEDLRPAIAFCENLERERNAALAEIEAMRAAIMEAHTALGGCLKYILRLPLSGSDSECETMDDGHHALRKLKHFLP